VENILARLLVSRLPGNAIERLTGEGVKILGFTADVTRERNDYFVCEAQEAADFSIFLAGPERISGKKPRLGENMRFPTSHGEQSRRLEAGVYLHQGGG